MVQETTRNQFLGFLCSRCKERIPVPPRVAKLYVEMTQGEASLEQDVRSWAFTLRCKICREEGIYPVKEIEEFAGPPRARDGSANRGYSTPR
jgi:hypothetical protein